MLKDFSVLFSVREIFKGKRNCSKTSRNERKTKISPYTLWDQLKYLNQSSFLHFQIHAVKSFYSEGFNYITYTFIEIKINEGQPSKSSISHFELCKKEINIITDFFPRHTCKSNLYVNSVKFSISRARRC